MVEIETDKEKRRKYLSELFNFILGKPPPIEGEEPEWEQVSITELDTELEKLKLKQQSEMQEALLKVDTSKAKEKATKPADLDGKADSTNIANSLKTILKRELPHRWNYWAPG